MTVLPTFRFTRPSFSSSRSDAGDQVPLNSLLSDEESDEFYYGKPAPRAGSWPLFNLKHTAVVVVGLSLLYFALDNLYTDPARWRNEWSGTLFGPTTISRSHIVHSEESGRRYIGTKNAAGNLLAWRGIRYAQPPVGERRFRNPVPVDPGQPTPGTLWEDVNATSYDDGCPRVSSDLSGFVGNEDCLSLNIHAPVRRIPNVLLPVLVWIHGGGFYGGAPHEVRYEPEDLLTRGVSMNQPFIFVSVGYRLGPLGFAASPPVPGGAPLPPHIPVRPPEELDLNVGLKDQLEALWWIRREIGAWGGDKNKVTLLGHSAGAISVGLHQLYSPPELFRAAFMLSGAPTSFPIPWPHDASARTLHPLSGTTGCPPPVYSPTGPPINTDLIACLRQLPLADFMWGNKQLYDRAPTNGYFPWYATLEGEWEGSWMDFRPSDRIARGTFSKIPVILGSVKDEGTRFASPEVKDEQGIKDALKGAFEFTYGAIETILTPLFEHYPDDVARGSPYLTGIETFGLSPSFKRLSSILGDVFFQAPRRHFLRETPKDFGEPSWNFYYHEPRPGSLKHNGVQHGADLASWFGHPETDDAELHELSRHMAAYLINFVSNLDPNGPGLRPWPQYGVDRKTLYLARKNITITHDDDRLEEMQFINAQNPLFADPFWPVSTTSLTPINSISLETLMTEEVGGLKVAGRVEIVVTHLSKRRCYADDAGGGAGSAHKLGYGQSKVRRSQQQYG